MKFKNFSDFYPYYLRQHSQLGCRRLHFVGTCAVISLLLLFFFTGNPLLLIFIPPAVYGFSWMGHFFFEKNRPLSFKYPLYNVMGDFKMFWDILSGRVRAF